MNKPNFYAMGESQILALRGERKDLLLHCCCAPCASSCMEYLKDFFRIHAYFYNPNIVCGEYERRKDELKRFLSLTGWADIVECEHDEEAFLSVSKGEEMCPEGGKRCEKCFYMRLENTAKKAKDLGCEYFCTTLTLSPLKNSALINAIGEKIGKDAGICWLYSDFKKKDGYLKSIKLSEEYGLYRQNYCGCEYSKRHDLGGKHGHQPLYSDIQP